MALWRLYPNCLFNSPDSFLNGSYAVVNSLSFPFNLATVSLASQRILEDFYDDRPTIEAQLKAKGRIP